MKASADMLRYEDPFSRPRIKISTIGGGVNEDRKTNVNRTSITTAVLFGYFLNFNFEKYLLIFFIMSEYVEF